MNAGRVVYHAYYIRVYKQIEALSSASNPICVEDDYGIEVISLA